MILVTQLHKKAMSRLVLREVLVPRNLRDTLYIVCLRKAPCWVLSVCVHVSPVNLTDHEYRRDMP